MKSNVSKIECDFELPFTLAGIHVPDWRTLPAFTGSNNIEITIGCSNWNRDGSIEACIISMCEQSFPKENYEIILIDDCSEDNSREIIKETIKRYPDHNIKYIELDESRTFNEHHPHNVTIRLGIGEIFLKNSGDNLYSYNFLEAVWRHHNYQLSKGIDRLFLTTYWGCYQVFSDEYIPLLMTKEYRDEDNLKPLLVHGVGKEAGEKGWCVDTGGSMRMKYAKEMQGYDEKIRGNTPGDVCLMCRLNFNKFLFGYEPNIYSIHFHKSSIKKVKRGMKFEEKIPWEPQVFKRNGDKYGDLTENEINNMIIYGYK